MISKVELGLCMFLWLSANALVWPTRTGMNNKLHLRTLDVSHILHNTTSRRNLLVCSLLSVPFLRVAESLAIEDEGGLLPPSCWTDLIYQRRLGKGSFKQVYHVTSNKNQTDWALSVQAIHTKSQAKIAFRELGLLREFRGQVSANDGRYLEGVEAWRLLPLRSLQSFDKQSPVLSATANQGSTTIRTPTQQEFRNSGAFALLILKPLYEMDLYRFMKQQDTMFPIKSSNGGSLATKLATTRRDPVALDESMAILMSLDMLHIGSILQKHRMIHRDIKPKNLMITSNNNGTLSLVLIDFGFADFSSTASCLVEAGKIKGEIDYTLAEDTASYRGCFRGDAYAMAKTMYEVLFCQLPILTIDSASARADINAAAVQASNDLFRSRLLQETEKPSESRFSNMRSSTRDKLLQIIVSLSRPENPIPFAQAEEELKAYSGV